MPTPKTLIRLVVMLAIASMVMFVALLLQPTYTGFNLESRPESRYLTVTRLDVAVAQQGLSLGDQVTHISNNSGLKLAIEAKHFPATTFDAQRIYQRDLKAVLVAFAKVHEVLDSDVIYLDLSNGEQVQIQLDKSRPLASVPWQSWARFLFGLAPWLLTALIWIWQPRRKETLFLMLSAIGLFLSAVPDAAMYQVEMYMVHPLLLRIQTLGIFTGVFMHWLFGICVLLYFPQKLKHADGISKALMLGVLFYAGAMLLNDWDWSLPVERQYLYFNYGEMDLPVPLFFFTTLFLCYLQWRASLRKPVERAQAAWIILAWTVGPSIYMLFFLLPIYLGGEPVLSRTWINLALLSTFAMVITGVARFKWFQLELHVFSAYQWVLVSIAFFALDIILVSSANVAPQISSLILLALVLWGYLPLKQFVHRRVVQSRQMEYQQSFNAAVLNMVQNSLRLKREPQADWQLLLDKLFSPLTVQASTASGTSALARGQTLNIAANRFSGALSLDYAEQGGRLFNRDDESLVVTLSVLFERLYDFRDAYFAGQSQERDRIRRDLHDQIGHKLLSLLYAAQDDRSRQLAQETIEQVGELITALKTERVALTSAIAELRHICEDSCEYAGLRLLWQDDIRSNDVEIGSSQYLNILNLVRELLNNTTRHSGAAQVSISILSTQQQLSLIFADDGRGFDLQTVARGNGLFNIESRLSELNATHTWRISNGAQLTMVIPIEVTEMELV